jgi:hypothetical protein
VTRLDLLLKQQEQSARPSESAISSLGLLTMISDYDAQLDWRNPTTPIVLDLRQLDFLNSSGITMLSRFVMEARGHEGIDIQVLASEAVPWHARSLKNLQRLMPTLTIRLS